MNDDQHDVGIDELHDRLIDRGLHELLGGQQAPDLSGRILAAAATTPSVPAAEATAVAEAPPMPAAQQKPRAARLGWRALAVAAGLLIALGGTALLLRPQDAKESSPDLARSGEREVAIVVDNSTSSSIPAKVAHPGLVNVLYGDGHAPTTTTASTQTATGSYTVNKRVWEGIKGKQYSYTVAKPVYDKTKLAEAARQVGHGDRILPQADQLALDVDGILIGGIDSEAPSNPIADGNGPGQGGDRYRRIIENAFLEARTNPLSTFSIDVDTASYANTRQFLMQQGVLPPPDAVRIEELVNYFRYNYAGPEDGRPFASHIEVADCPWQPKHKLVRVAIKGREIAPEKRPAANLVFLIDVSGSMDEPQKLPLLVRALTLLTEQLRGDDRVAIVVYAGSSGLVLPSTPGESRETILAALKNLQAGGSTNGGAGIELAYKVARQNHIDGGINRVILCTDGDFNVGVTSDGALERLIEEKRTKDKTFLTVLGFGRGNFNDSMLESLSGKGNGNYAYVDNIAEARKVLVEQLTGTLMTIAKDVKIQIEFNPAKVAGYRLLGYEDRLLAAEDFNDDKKDAGEIGSGHTVTALYEIVPAGAEVPATKVDELKYQKPKQAAADETSKELLTLKIRYKDPTADKSQLIETALRDEAKKFAAATSDFQFAAAVAGFGMLLRGSQHKGNLTYDAVLEIAAQHKGDDAGGYRAELLEMIRKAKGLAGKK